jgi:hypothetical protein
LHPSACLRGAFDVLGTDFLCDLRALVWSDGLLALRAEHASRIVIPTQVRLGCDEDEWCAIAEVGHLRVPLASCPSHQTRTEEYKAKLGTHLVLDVPKAHRKVDGKYDENDVAFWVTQWPQTIILLLTCRVPQCNFNDFALKLSVCHVVLKHSGDVCLVRLAAAS